MLFSISMIDGTDAASEAVNRGRFGLTMPVSKISNVAKYITALISITGVNNIHTGTFAGLVAHKKTSKKAPASNILNICVRFI